MRLTEFRVPVKEAPIDDLKAKYAAMLKQLKLEPGDDEGFFGRNFRNNANNEILATFAQDNDLPGMFNPETGRFIKFGEDEEGADSGMVDDISTPDFDQLQKLADLGAIPPAAQDELAKEIEAYDSGERSLSRRDLIGNLLGNKNPEDRDRLLDILKRNSTSGKDQGTTATVDKDGKPTDNAKIPNLDLPATATPADQTGPARDADDADVKIPDLDKDLSTAQQAAKDYGGDIAGGEFGAGSNPLATKPGDYTGADGVEDMSTGMFVKPDAPAGAAKPEPAKQEPPAATKPEKKGKVKATAANTRDYDKTLALQKQLIKRGAKIKADGIMGPNTQRALDAEIARRDNADSNKPAGSSDALPPNMPVPSGTMPKIPGSQSGNNTPTGTMTRSRRRAQDRVKKQGAGKPEDSRSWWEKNAPNWLGGEPDPVAKPKAPGDKPAVTVPVPSRTIPNIPGAEPGGGNTKKLPDINLPVLGPTPKKKDKPIPKISQTKKKDKPIPKISQNFTTIPQTQMAGKEFTKPKLETRDGMRSLQDKLNEIAERD